MKGLILIKVKLSKKIGERELTKRLKQFKENNMDVIEWAEFAHYPSEHPLVI